MTFYLNFLFTSILLIYLLKYKLDILFLPCFFYYFSFTMVCSEIYTGDQLLWYVACILLCSLTSRKRSVEKEAFKVAGLIIIRRE